MFEVRERYQGKINYSRINRKIKIKAIVSKQRTIKEAVWKDKINLCKPWKEA